VCEVLEDRRLLSAVANSFAAAVPLTLVEAATNQAPTIGSLTDSPDPVVRGNNLTLTAGSVADSDGSVAKVEFYLNTDSNSTIDVGTDTLLGTDSDGSDGWTCTVSSSGFPAGPNTYMARAQDNSGDWSETKTTTGSVNDDATAPGLLITYPTNGSTVYSASLTVTGTASDVDRGSNGVSSVMVNGVSATGGTASGSGTANWSATITLVSGANTITVVAKDSQDNERQQQITVTYTPAVGPTVTKSPDDMVTDVGLAAVTFTATATGTPTPAVKWQVDTGSGVFADLSNDSVYSGVTSTTLTVTGATLAMNGYKYQAVFTNEITPDATTSAATLTVNPALSIAPTTLSGGKVGVLYQQTINVTGGATYTTFKIDKFSDGGTGLTTPTISGGTVVVSGTPTAIGTATFTVVVVDSAGGSITQPYSVAINEAPLITTHPSSVATDVGLAAVTFTAAASGTPTPDVKWQVDTGSGVFADLSNDGVYSGVTSTTLTVTGATLAMDGYKYHAVFTNGVLPDAATSAATLSVKPALAIAPSTLPSGVVNTLFNQTITVTGGTTPYTTFTVSEFNADGTGLTSSEIVANAAAGTIVINGTPTHVGSATFKVTLGDTVGGTLVQNYSIVINEPPTVTTHPSDATTNVGLAVTLTAVASGTPTPTVKWQVNTGTGSEFTDLTNSGVYSGVTATTLTITGATAAMNGYKYRAMFSNVVQSGVPTTAATLTVNPALQVTVTTLPAGVVNMLYHQTITVFGGTTPYTTFKIDNFNAGGTGLTAQQIVADASTGTIVINGTPVASGSASFTLSVIDTIGATLSQQYTIAVNMRPSVSAVTPTGTQSGNVTIDYTLIDQESNTCSVQVLYSLDGDTWYTATRADSGDGTSGLTSAPGGVNHTFVWASSKDIVDQDAAKVLVTIVPSDASGAGTAATTGEFAVANYVSQRPAAFATTPLGTQSGNVTISYSLSDKESDLCSILVEYSPNGGTTWYTATKAAGGEGTTNLTSGSKGASHTFVWASGHDMANISSSKVLVRITPSDAIGAGTPGSSTAFTVDNFVNYDPLVTIRDLAIMPDGSVIVAYSLADGNSDVCRVAVKYYRNGVWCFASSASGQGDGTTNLGSSPGGVSHLFVWASSYDLPNSTNTNVRISIVPYDGNGAGMGGTTATFTVTNHPYYRSPAINRVGVAEAAGRRNGRLETDEKLVITWAASSTSRIVSQGLTIDGHAYGHISGPYNGIYYSCSIGRLGAGVHNYTIGATNAKGLSFSNRGSFTVSPILPPLIDGVAVGNGTLTWVASSWYGIVSQTLWIDGYKVGSAIHGPAGKSYYYSNIGARAAGTHTYVIKATDGRHLTSTKTGTFKIPATLLVSAAAGSQKSVGVLSDAELAPIVAEAIHRLESELGSGVETTLAGVKVKVADLSSGVLGEAMDDTIWIDRDAAGYGWFVDPTPEDDAEFTALSRSSLSARKDTAADQRADLLTTVMHELGHLLGYGDTAADNLMGAVLPLGVRRVATTPA
jgi:hypothetical protein